MAEMLHSTPSLHQVLNGPWLAALPLPVLAFDANGVICGANLPAAHLLGVDVDELQARRFPAGALGEEHRDRFEEILGEVLTGTPWSGTLPLGTSPDTVLQVVPVHDQGAVIGALATVASAGAGGFDIANRLNLLASVATELQSARDLAGLTNIVVSHLADAAGATTASLSVLIDDDTLALIGVRGGVAGASSRWATYPADDTNPAGVALRAAEPLLLAGRDVILNSFPDLELDAPGQRSLLCLPLRAGARNVGVMTLSFPTVLASDDAELEFLQILADSCGQAVERIRALETVEQQHAKLTFLAEASAELASSLDYESTLRNVAQMAVPDLADWCAISLAQDGILRTLAVAHRDPAKVELALNFQQRYPADPKAETGGYQVLRTGRPEVIAEVTDEMLVAGAQSEEHLAMLRDLALHSAITVPLQAEGRVFGTISWINGETERRFSTDDLPFAEDLGRRAGIAIDNALLHSELREVAERLQEAVRPADLPRPPGWQLGATYSSAGRASVGGDFYDVIPLRDGRVALVIGDVMGRGVAAAAAMSQIKAALRALVAVDPDPSTVMTRLDLLYERFPSDQLVTLLYVLADPDLDQLELSCAGHPAPIVVHDDGSAEFVQSARGTILGVEPSSRRSVATPFLEGDTILMYTDGLFERRDEDPQTSEARLLETYQALRPAPTAEDLEHFVTQMRDPSRDDDVAVLAARRLSSP